jgi:hypothetical protein
MVRRARAAALPSTTASGQAAKPRWPFAPPLFVVFVRPTERRRRVGVAAKAAQREEGRTGIVGFEKKA